VALLFTNPVGGGVQRVMRNLGTALAGQGVAVDLVVARAPEGVPELPPGIRLVNLRARRTVDVLPGLVRYLRAASPRAILSAGERLNVLAVLARSIARSDARAVVSVHIALSEQFRSARDPRSWLLRRVVPLAYRRADAVVAVSRAAARDAARLLRLPPDRVRTIYNPVVTPELFRQAAEPCGHPWLSPHRDRPVVLAMGRLTRQKDLATLLRAFARVRAARPARLMVLGEGEDLPALQALAAELGLTGDVEFAGFVANPYPFLARADAFALSSAWEGLPTVLIEALALGVPAVSTDCPTGPAEILDGGRRGALVPVGDEAALAAALLGVLARPSARTPVELPEFGVEAAVSEYLRVLGVSRAA
jgi:glycosyltransferase involved in cell wall biosynthesis